MRSIRSLGFLPYTISNGDTFVVECTSMLYANASGPLIRPSLLWRLNFLLWSTWLCLLRFDWNVQGYHSGWYGVVLDLAISKRDKISWNNSASKHLPWSVRILSYINVYTRDWIHTLPPFLPFASSYYLLRRTLLWQIITSTYLSPDLLTGEIGPIMSIVTNSNGSLVRIGWSGCAFSGLG